MPQAPKDRPAGSRPDLLAGAIFVAVGSLGLWAGRALPMGITSSMGPGYLPFAVSSFIVAIGLAVMAVSFVHEREALRAIRLRPVVTIVAAIVGFAYLAEYLGFIIAAVWLVGIASIADRDSRRLEVLLSIVGLTLFSIAVFIFGLGVQIRLWPS